MAPKEKKKSGIFSIFRKKHAPKEKESNNNNTGDSFAEIKNLIPEDKPVNRVANEEVESKAELKDTKTSRSTTMNSTAGSEGKRLKKTRAPLPPNQERAVDVPTPAKPPRKVTGNSEHERSEGAVENTAKQDEWEQNSSTLVRTEIIHYSPHGSIRSTTSSPDPISDVPLIQRQSNIILSDSKRMKSIPVTCYDGRSRKKAPLPPTNTDLRIDDDKTVASTAKSIEYKAPSGLESSEKGDERSNGTSSSKRENESMQNTVPPSIPKHQYVNKEKESKIASLPRLDAPPRALHHRMPSQQEDELKLRYEALKAKFDLWQIAHSKNKHSAEAKKLQMELVRDHDEVMQMAKSTLPDTAQYPTLSETVKKQRPSITSDTFRAKAPLEISIRSPVSVSTSHTAHDSITSPAYSSSPGTSRSVTPKYSSPSSSVSPSASIESSDSGVVKGNTKPIVSSTRTKRLSTLDENSNLVVGGKKKHNDQEKLNAINRINEEAKELLRKEKELRSQDRRKSQGAPQPPSISTDSVQVKDIERNNAGNKTIPAQSKAVSSRSPILESRTPPVPTTPIPKLPSRTSGTEETVQSSNILFKQSKTSSTGANTSQDAYVTNSSQPIVHKRVFSGEANYVKTLAPTKTSSPLQPPLSKPALRKETKPSGQETTANRVATRNISEEIKPAGGSEPNDSTQWKAYDDLLPSRQSSASSMPRAQPTHSKKSDSDRLVSPPSSHKNRTPPSVKVQKVKTREPIGIGEIFENGFPVLKKVDPPVERSGISLGKVIDSPGSETSRKVVETKEIERKEILIPSPPPPPPPPPASMLQSPSVTLPSVSSPMNPPPPPPPPLVSIQQLNDQKQKLKPASVNETPRRGTPDLRDTLMEEIRNAGGKRTLKKISPTVK